MKKISFWILCSVSLNQFYLSSQTSTGQIKRCSTSEKMEEIRLLDPVSFDNLKIQKESEIQNWIANHYENFTSTRAILTIPVVVQIFGSVSNNEITDARVMEQLEVLNQDYRRLNSDAGNVPSVFESVAADCEIEFCLATKDENDNPTSGIIRNTSLQEPNNNSIWDPSLYLNLFVYELGFGALGFTYTPSNFPNEGVHIGYDYFGKTGASAPFNKGRTATHEVGHWFNLEHIWGDNQCGSDLVNDTPTHEQDNYGCHSHPKSNSCGTSAEMFMNYMDYTDDGCMYMFTLGQKARMIAAINLYRPELLNNGKCDGFVTPPIANFSPSQTWVCQNSDIAFTNTSSGSPTSLTWSFPGGNPSTSTSPNPTINYPTAGVYSVTLTASNSGGENTQSLLNLITISNCASIGKTENSSVNIYPNPAKEFMIIELNESSKENLIQIVDYNGQLVYEKKLSSVKEEISLDKISNGLYQIKLIQESGVSISKFQILK